MLLNFRYENANIDSKGIPNFITAVGQIDLRN